MTVLIRRFVVLCISATVLLIGFRQLAQQDDLPPPHSTSSSQINHPVIWKDVPLRYPVSSMIPLPSGAPSPIPKIQHEFGVETENNKAKRKERLETVKKTFLHSWEGYKKHAWLQDEVTPVSGGYKNGFGRRGATLVDTLDTLSIMGLDKEFNLALSALNKIDFSTTEEPTLNVFETTIRYLGGLLSAYDLNEGRHRILLDKAVELGDMLYIAFDTPNRLPITRWDWANGALEGEQEAPSQALSAEIGSLSLEFTRLSQLTGDPKYFDAVQRISNQFEKHQNSTSIPEQYRKLYEGAIEAAKKHLFFRPMNPQNQDILISGTVRKNAADFIKLQPEGQHLACFAGGMVGIGSKIFERPDELDIARKLVDGCIWAYDSMPTGIMPESFVAVPCPDPKDCTYSTEKWHEAVINDRSIRSTLDVARIIREDGLVPGFTEISDRRFLLRPEAIESVFILYRITGDTSLQDSAWRMFQSIQNSTQTPIANSAIADVTCPPEREPEKLDECESFWMAETLKYFYLVFSEPDVVSLDDWVFNTEAHPLRRPQSS
ncbi:glycoside hydrolase family 47 protein [Zopfia rhizophila CBS 207.26]|uniref:alpha-1,2-Mannosidase n=1 Tax=Zopfia rhizophila CBS 207.26 TaxID=1314779 RepID=A0A6A6E9N8_9PEZI|nr:glycoside hydrolase family 47 protein [Zopfia rhizophila CBS 207.26]